MDVEFLKDYEESNGFEFSESEKNYMVKQDYCCDTCGNSFKDYNDDFRVIDDEDRLICYDCYDQDFNTECGVCRQTFEKPTLEDHYIYINSKLAIESKLETGIYKVKSYPFYYGSILSGFDAFFNSSLELVKDLDIEKSKKLVESFFHREECSSGDICETCVNEWRTVPRLYYKNKHLNEIFKNQSGIHSVITKKGIIKNGLSF